MNLKQQHLFLATFASVASLSLAFQCFTGHQDTFRRKNCREMRDYFSDRCFKVIDFAPGEVQRGCFNSKIGAFITEKSEIGCHRIPAKFGKGTICLCDSDLCNHGTTNRNNMSSKYFLGLGLAVTVMLLQPRLFSF